ncbi:hypothetical protein ACFLU6_14640 [Acidobacteriota bacterium]
MRTKLTPITASTIVNRDPDPSHLCGLRFYLSPVVVLLSLDRDFRKFLAFETEDRLDAERDVRA